MGSTGGIAGILDSILSPGAGNIGGSFADLISRTNDRNVQGLRARFGASGGTAFGTPAMFAESRMRAEQAPLLTQAIGNLQLGAINPLLSLMGGLSQKGISQREGYLQPSGFASTMATLAPIIGTGLGLMSGNPLAAFGGAMGGMQQAPNIAAGTMFGQGNSAPSLFSGGLPNMFSGPLPTMTAPRLDWTFR